MLSGTEWWRRCLRTDWLTRFSRRRQDPIVRVRESRRPRARGFAEVRDVSAVGVPGAVVAAEDLSERLGVDQPLRLHGMEHIGPALSAPALLRDLIQRQRRPVLGRALLSLADRADSPLLPCPPAFAP